MAALLLLFLLSFVGALLSSDALSTQSAAWSSLQLPRRHALPKLRPRRHALLLPSERDAAANARDAALGAMLAENLASELVATQHAWHAPLPLQAARRAQLATVWLLLLEGDGGAGDLLRTRAGPRMRLAVRNLGMRVLLVPAPGRNPNASARDAAILAHWRAQIRNPPFDDAVELLSDSGVHELVAQGSTWLAPVLGNPSTATSVRNAASLRAIERGARVVYEWSLLRAASARAGEDDELELELDTPWPVLLPDVLPGEMATTAALAGSSALDGLLGGGHLAAAASQTTPELAAATTTLQTSPSGVRPALLLHCVRSESEGDASRSSGDPGSACGGTRAVTALAPGAYFAPPQQRLASVHVRLVEYDGLLALFLPHLALQQDADGEFGVDAAWLSLAFRDIWAQRLAADIGQAAALVPQIGSATSLVDDVAHEPPVQQLPLIAVELASAAAAAATAWVVFPAPLHDRNGSANDTTLAPHRAASLLAAMCTRMAAAHTPSALTPDACGRLLRELADWLRALASVHYDLSATPLPNCSAAAHADAQASVRENTSFLPPIAVAALTRAVSLCQAATTAARMAWWAAHPISSGCGGRSVVPYYRRWRWNLPSGWTLDWAGADSPVPGEDDVPAGPLPSPLPLYPTNESVAATRAMVREHAATGAPGPFIVPDDVMVFVYSYDGRTALQRQNRRSWASFARHVVHISTTEDESWRTLVLRATRPEWEAVAESGHDAAYAPYALQYLYEIGRPQSIKFFLNFDDDAIPLWPSLLANLRAYQDAHGGRYPFIVSGYVEGLTTPEQQLFATVDASGGERHKARLALGDDAGIGAPSGFSYGFNLAMLHDLVAVAETCPVWAPGDGEQGGLMACAGRLAADIGRERGALGAGQMPDFGPSREWLQAPERSVYDFYGEDAARPGTFFPPVPERITVYHGLKDPERMGLLYDGFYGAFGFPLLEEIGDNSTHHHRGDKSCVYAPPGRHLFEWRGSGVLP